MSFFAVWIDRKTAKIFQISQDKMERQTLHLHSFDQPTHPTNELDQKQREHRFYSRLVVQLNSAEALLILGPGVAKHHFHNHLTEHFPALARKMVGCETVDQPTDSQIAVMAKKLLAEV